MGIKMLDIERVSSNTIPVEYRSMSSLGQRQSVVVSDTQLKIVINGATSPSCEFLKRRTNRISVERPQIISAIPDSIISNWTLLALSTISHENYLRLYKLASLKAGWRGARSKQLNARSLTDFLRFWRAINFFANEPHLSLSPNGSIIAEWHKNSRRNLFLEFLASGEIYIGLTDGSLEYDARDNKIGAIAFLKNRPSKPLRWR